MSKNCQKKLKKNLNGLQRKVSCITHTCTDTQIYMGVKICTINFDYDANGTESLGLVKKIMLFHLVMFVLIVKHECFSCSRNEKQLWHSKSILHWLTRNLSRGFQRESRGCDLEGLQRDPGICFSVLI